MPNPISRIEAFALAIAHENSALDPGSDALITLNPGLLKAHSIDRLQIVNADGIRVFSSFYGGYKALLANIDAKCAGRTQAHTRNGKLCPQSSIDDLVRTFAHLQTRKIVELLQEYLDDKAITERTPLEFFLTK